ncbi:MAG: hypothetical protein B6244_09315 [Candidatus Cloacimonetes bacterium 4572_55]|nr:MAG: hypothetical protein B6244_09315 [Candidatus Cloacimonetes bacterium 4572_55]
MKKMIVFLTVATIFWSAQAFSQPVDRLIQSLPLFVGWSSVKAKNETLKIGVFSDKTSRVDNGLLSKFQKLKPWNHDLVKEFIGHNRIDVIFLNSDNLSDFDGQIIWVLDADASLKALRKKTMEGVFTIGAQHQTFEAYIAATLMYENKSNDPKVERWRLIRFFGNCEISPLIFSNKLKSKENFVSKNCQ